MRESTNTPYGTNKKKNQEIEIFFFVFKNIFFRFIGGWNDVMSQVEMLNPPRELACVRVLRPFSTLFRLISSAFMNERGPF